jgi:hypothetical protein
MIHRRISPNSGYQLNNESKKNFKTSFFLKMFLRLQNLLFKKPRIKEIWRFWSNYYYNIMAIFQELGGSSSKKRRAREIIAFQELGRNFFPNFFKKKFFKSLRNVEEEELENFILQKLVEI